MKTLFCLVSILLLQYCLRQWCLQIWPIHIAILFLAVVLFVTIAVVYIKQSTENFSSENIIPASTDNSKLANLEDYPINMRYVLRNGWGAAQPLEEFDNNTLPLERVIFIHTASGGTCNNNIACIEQVKDIQMYHMTQRNLLFGDIGYNFVIGSDGYIYVGVGWDKVGAHTKGQNIGSLGVAFIGNFMTDIPNDLMLSSAKRLLQFGVKRKKLSENYQLFGHCQALSSFPYSPGNNIMKEINTWPHWNSTNADQCKG